MVYILDFSYNLETTTKLWHFHGGRVTLLDHHKSAMEELQGQLPGCYFDMNRSAAAIAWGYFKPLERMPDLLAYVQDRDLWRWELLGSVDICICNRCAGPFHVIPSAGKH